MTVVLLALALQLPVAQAATALPPEPALQARLTDAQTGKPLVHAWVLGHYVTGRGSLAGGHTRTGVLYPFAVETDQHGVFKLPARDMSAVPPEAVLRDRFPVLAFYMPGYRTDLHGLATLRQWRPNGAWGQAQPKLGTWDWTDWPHALTPVSSELDRYLSVRAAMQALAYDGPCGWQAVAPALQALHDEHLGIIARSVGQAQLDQQGYLRSGQPHPMPNVDFLTRTPVDRLLAAHAQSQGQSPDTWPCKDPKDLFRRRAD